MAINKGTSVTLSLIFIPIISSPNLIMTLCGSLLKQRLYRLPSPRSSDISFGCAWSWSGRLRSLQGGWHFDSHSRVGIRPVEFPTLR